MGNLVNSYYKHMIAKENELGDSLDTFSETKAFMEGKLTEAGLSGKVSDQAVSNFISKNLPESEAGAGRVFMNWFSQTPHMVVEGVQRFLGEAGTVGSLIAQGTLDLTDPTKGAPDVVNASETLGAVEAETVNQAPFGFSSPTLKSIHDFSVDLVKTSHKDQEQLIPDFAREKATGFAGKMAWDFGELLIGDAPSLALMHKPSVGFADAVAKPLVSWASKSAPALTEKMASNMVGRFTQKALANVAHEMTYGVPQTLGLTLTNRGNFVALDKMLTGEDPLERQKAGEYLAERIGEDQAFNLIASAALGGLAPLVGAGFSKFKGYVAEVLPPIADLQATGKVPPLPVSQNVKDKITALATVTDPVEANKLAKQIEFVHADEIDTYLGNWIPKIDSLISDNFGLSRTTGAVVKGWLGELDQKIQKMGQLLEDGSPIAEPHIDAIEKLVARADQLETLYETKGLKRIDEILTSPVDELDAEGKLIRGIFEAVDKEKGAYKEGIEPGILSYFRLLQTKTALVFNSAVQRENFVKAIPEKAARETFVDLIAPMAVKDPAQAMTKIVDSFFDPEVVMNRREFIEILFSNRMHFDPDMLTDPNKLKAGVQKFMSELHAAGEVDPYALTMKLSNFDVFDAVHDPTIGFNLFGTTSDGKKRLDFSFTASIQKFPEPLAAKAIAAMRDTAKAFYNGFIPKKMQAGIDMLDALYGKAKAEWQNKFTPVAFNSDMSDRGIFNAGYQLALGKTSNITTAIHEITHMFESFLSEDTKNTLFKYFEARTAKNDIMPFFDYDNLNLNKIDLKTATNTLYWRSSTEQLARYMQFVLSGDLAHTTSNVLSLPAETLAELRHIGGVFKNFSGDYLGDRAHSIVARDFFGLFIDDVNKVALVTERKLGELGKDFKETLKDRLPQMAKEFSMELDSKIASSLSPTSVAGTAFNSLRDAIQAVDKELKITHEHKSMISLIDRFFTLKDTFQHYINRPELRGFYDDVVFRGNKKILADLHEGFSSLDKVASVLGHIDDKQKLAQEYGNFKNFVMTAEGIISAAYQHSPSVWTSHTTLGYRQGLVSAGKELLRKLPYFKNREGISADISKLDRLTSQAEFLTKKFPALKPVYGAVERFIEDSQRWMTGALDGSLKGLNRNEAFLPLEHYFKLEEGSKTLKAVDDLLLRGNEVGNQLQNWPKDQPIPPEFVLDGLGMVNKNIYRKEFKHLSDSEYELVWGIYGGVREMLNHVSNDMRGLMTRFGSDAKELTLMDKKFGKLRGYIPQTRKGKYFIEVLEDVQGKKKQDKTVIFSDDLASLRKMEEEAKAAGNSVTVGVVTKRMDTGHFAPSLASLEKVLKSVGEKASLDDDAMKLLKNETISLIKSNSYLANTLKRRDVAGWDKTRVRESIYEYVQGFSRFRHRHDAMTEALDGLKYLNSSKYAEAWKWGQELIFDVSKTQDTYKALDFASKAVYWKYLAFNASSAAMQLTQIPTMSLSRMVLEGLPRSGRLLTVAIKDIVSGGNKLAPFEKRALEEGYALGITYANFVQELRHNVSKTSKLGKKAQTVFDFSMEPMRIMEEFNRKTTLLAAYRGVREQLLSDLPATLKANKETVHRMALERAITIVKDSQLTYTKMNKPELIRGDSAVKQLGRQAYILKQFTHGYGQLFGYMLRNGKEGEKAALKSLAALGAIGGAAALPGFSLISPFLEKVTSEDAYEHLEKLGTFGNVLAHGASAMLPTKLGRRLNPIPSTGSEMLLPPGMSLLEGIGNAKEHYEKGDLVRLLFDMPFVPNAFGNPIKAVEQGMIGRTTQSGKVIPKTKADISEMVSQFAGFSPWNEQFVKYQRGKRKEAEAVERRASLFAKIRQEANRGGISNSSRKEFYAEQIKMLKDGKRMSYRIPEDVLEE